MKTIALAVLLTISCNSFAAAEQNFDAVSVHGNWSVFTDSDVCWIGSYPFKPFLEERGPRLTVTFYDDVYDGALAVFDPERFKGADLIAVVVGDNAFPLDKDHAEPEYAFNNTRGLMRAIDTSEDAEVEIKFADSKKQVSSYMFSLVGYDDAMAEARGMCDGQI